MIEIDYKDISKDILFENNHQEVIIKKENEKFYIKIELKENNDKIVVFSNGAVNRETKFPPIFMRSSWADEVNASCLYIDDKTIHGGNLRIGWGVGTKDRHFINDYSQITKKITAQLEIRAQNVIYFGSSAGGFMSLLLACKHMYSTAIVNNPQTNIFKFREAHVKELCDFIFPELSQEEIQLKYNDRFSVTDFFLKKDYIPRIYYYQNRKHKFDMDNHFIPFVKELELHEMSERKIVYHLYNNIKLGHDPLPKELTIANINHVVNTIGLKY